MPPSTVDLLVEKVAAALTPVGTALSAPQRVREALNTLGWDLPPNVANLGLTAASAGTVVQKLQIVLRSTEAERADDAVMIGRYAELLIALIALITEVQANAEALA